MNGFGIPYRVVHDTDEEGEGGANAAILELLGGTEGRRLTHEPNFEQHVFGQTWDRDKPWRTVNAIASMTAVGADLLKFVEFALGCPIAELQQVGT